MEIIPGLLAGIDRAKQSVKTTFGLLADNPQEYFRLLSESARDINRQDDLAIQGKKAALAGRQPTQDELMAMQGMRQRAENLAGGFVGSMKVSGSGFTSGRNPIVRDGKEVGYVKVDDTPQALRIADIEVSPSWRNKGIGSDTIKQLIGQAEASGKPVVLSSDAMRGKQAQAGQRRLYERLGFQRNSGFKTDGVVEEYVYMPSGLLGSSKTPYELAHEVAQKNAVEMLGLPPGNTAMDRARALGFEDGLLHGTTNDFPAFKVSDRSNVYATDAPHISDIYANATGRHKALREVNANPNVIPLMYRGKLLEVSDQGATGGGYVQDNMAAALGTQPRRGLYKELPKHGYSGAKITNMDDLGGRQTQYVFPDPAVLRARTAAFDPKRINDPDLLAAGVPLGLLAGMEVELPKPEKKKPKKKN